MNRTACASLLAAAVALFTPSAPAAYPEKPVRLLIPFAPGGGTDILARAVSDKLTAVLGVPVVIDNRPGAGSTLGVGMVARAAPDGYTFLFTSASYTFAPNFYRDLPYDPIKDFRPITMFGSSPSILVVHPSLPVKNVKGLLALARKRPGDIYYASAGRGSNIHLTTELFLYKAKIRITQVPYKGGGPALIAVMSGESQMVMPSLNSALPFVKSGRLRALGVSSKQRSALLPDVPTIDASGVPGYIKSAWFGLFAPAGVPEPIITRVYQAVTKVLKDPDIVKRLTADATVPEGQPPAEFAAFVHSELAEWAKLIRDMKL
ncbi:MAG TPA: tripartite tricarboxylate transporter substrate binding protein [Burkholderiales bacterium]|nr:tripartite tricarboxylate transporter substrate binding protein [Burkholderiales bacterium]